MNHYILQDVMIHYFLFESRIYGYNYKLMKTCFLGHRDLAKWMILKGANNWNFGLQGACQGGHRDLAELMINKGANNWNWGVCGACQGGYRNLAKWMIDLGADPTKCYGRKHCHPL